MSFAQFERELIGERVRDKIAASKRKGIWVGGPVPLGYRCIDKKIAVAPGEAETVRTIFARYLDLGSVRALADDLDRRGVRSKVRRLSTGRTVGGGRFGVGALAHLLKNRFYIGEVVYRGEVHVGDHTPILDRDLFEAVQARLAAQAVERRCRLRGSAALLAGRLYDERGSRMSPSHTNKAGVRYRYYVSQAILQNKTAGLVGRVPAPEIETLVIDALRKRLQESGPAPSVAEDARELIDRNLERVTLSARHIEIQWRPSVDMPAAMDPAPRGQSAVESEADSDGTASAALRHRRLASIAIPWMRPKPTAAKGMIRVPAYNAPIKPSRRDSLLIAIAKARQWIEDLAHGRASSFEVIARREGKSERHIRLLAPLAFVSPRIVAAILDGTAPAGFTASSLARALPWSWADQERQFGFEGPGPGGGAG